MTKRHAAKRETKIKALLKKVFAVLFFLLLTSLVVFFLFYRDKNNWIETIVNAVRDKDIKARIAEEEKIHEKTPGTFKIREKHHPLSESQDQLSIARDGDIVDQNNYDNNDREYLNKIIENKH